MNLSSLCLRASSSLCLRAKALASYFLRKYVCYCLILRSFSYYYRCQSSNYLRFSSSVRSCCTLTRFFYLKSIQLSTLLVINLYRNHILLSVYHGSNLLDFVLLDWLTRFSSKKLLLLSKIKLIPRLQTTFAFVDKIWFLIIPLIISIFLA